MNQGNQNSQPLDNQNIPEPQSKPNLSEPSKIKKIKTRQTLQNEPEEDEDKVYERVKQSRFKQQNLPALRPVPTILSIVIVFAFFGILFIILGIVLLVSYWEMFQTHRIIGWQKRQNLPLLLLQHNHSP